MATCPASSRAACHACSRRSAELARTPPSATVPRSRPRDLRPARIPSSEDLPAPDGPMRQERPAQSRCEFGSRIRFRPTSYATPLQLSAEPEAAGPARAAVRVGGHSRAAAAACTSARSGTPDGVRRCDAGGANLLTVSRGSTLAPLAVRRRRQRSGARALPTSRHLRRASTGATRCGVRRRRRRRRARRGRRSLLPGPAAARSGVARRREGFERRSRLSGATPGDARAGGKSLRVENQE